MTEREALALLLLEPGVIVARKTAGGTRYGFRSNRGVLEGKDLDDEEDSWDAVPPSIFLDNRCSDRRRYHQVLDDPEATTLPNSLWATELEQVWQDSPSMSSTLSVLAHRILDECEKRYQRKEAA